MLGLEPGALERQGLPERLARVYRAFVTGLPFENLSEQRACRAAPSEPEAWPRATDRLLRDHHECGLGGTSFSLAYALRDVLHGVGANAHLALGRNLVTEEAHALALVFLDEETLLYDPAMLVSGPIPARAGAALRDPLGVVCLESARGRTLLLSMHMPGLACPRPAYTVDPVPAPPHRYRQAWIASLDRGRPRPLRLARRSDDVIRRWSEGSRRLETLTPEGTQARTVPCEALEELQQLFGIHARCLREWWQGPATGPGERGP
jgi:hypothetical protein